MAIVHVNGFGTIPVSGDACTLFNAPTGTSSWSRQPGRFNGYALRHTNSVSTSGYVGRLMLPTPTGLEFSIGVAINHRSVYVPSGSTTFGFRATPPSGSWEINLGTGASNTYESTPSGSSPWTVIDSSATSIGWHWWNWVFRSNATTGICQLYRDGVLLAQTGTDTVPTTAVLPWMGLSIYMGNSNASSATQADFGDLIVRDDAVQIPDMAVSSLFPDGDSGTPQWVGSDGNSTDNYALLNENPTYDPAAYVGSPTVGATDTYTLSNLPGSAASVAAVQVSARAFKSDAGAKTLATLTNGTPGAAVDPGGAKTVYQITTANPAGGAWDQASVNAMTAGVRVIS